jgi:hypothetical protein
MAADDAPEVILFVERRELSDGSFVFNVVLGDMRFAATSQDDAEEFAEKISDAINEDTTQTAGVIVEF